MYILDSMRFRLALLAVLSALLITLAVPNELFTYGNAFFDLICLVPLWIAIGLSPSRRYTHLLGLLFGVVSSLATYFWLAFFKDFSTWTIGGVTLGFAYQFFIFAPFLFTFSRASTRWRPFIFAAAWTVYEYFKSIGFLGFPWGLLAYPVGGILPLVQIADITGVWGVSFLVAAVNGMIGETLFRLLHVAPAPLQTMPPSLSGGLSAKGELLRGWAVVALLTVGFLAYGFVQMGEPIPFKTKLSLLLVQQNIDSWRAGMAMPSIKEGEELTRAAIAHAKTKPDLVVWSEESFRMPYQLVKPSFETEPAGDPFLKFMKEIDTPLLVGSPYILNFQNQDAENATILIGPNGELLQHYGKHHLVPFAEYIPFWNVPAVREFMENAVGIGGMWTPGKRYTVYSTPAKEGGVVRFSTPICFEDSFPYLGRIYFQEGADLLINLTNDSWSHTVSAETQHLVAARYRAIEAKRVLVRSANSGITAVIDPYGRITAMLPPFTAGALDVTVPVYKEKQLTPYILYGDWVPIVLAVWLFGVLLRLAGYLPRRKPAAATRGHARKEPDGITELRDTDGRSLDDRDRGPHRGDRESPAAQVTAAVGDGRPKGATP